MIEHYRSFIKFVDGDVRSKKASMNRQMLRLLGWSFVLPVLFIFTATVLIKVGMVSGEYKKYFDWLLLLCPLLYSVYLVGSDYFKDFGKVFKSNGSSSMVRRAIKEAEWREGIVAGFHQKLGFSKGDWAIIRGHFKAEIELSKKRNVYLTILAGSVLFFAFNGLELLDNSGPNLSTMLLADRVHPGIFVVLIQGFLESLAQGSVLILFLILFYFSSHQITSALEKYLDCIDLLLLHQPPKFRDQQGEHEDVG